MQLIYPFFKLFQYSTYHFQTQEKTVENQRFWWFLTTFGRYLHFYAMGFSTQTIKNRV